MRKLLLAVGVALALSTASQAAPLCSSFFGQSVVDINAAGGCEIGALIFDDFQVINNGGFTSANINVGAGTGLIGPDAVFAFAMNTTPPVAGPTGGDIILQYSVTGLQIGAGLFIGTAHNVAITETICTNPFAGPLGTTCVVPPAIAYTLNVAHPAPPGQTVAALNFVAPLNVAYVQKDIAFGPGGSISDFINVHTTAVPEPATSLLMGTALLGAALMRKRFSQK